MRAVSVRSHRIETSIDPLYVTAGEIRERFGVSDMWIRRRIAYSNFPKPIKFTSSQTSRRFWRLGDVEIWERKRIRVGMVASRRERIGESDLDS
jgi:predicted DNA-binding transcriptional regulator AlpA